MCKQFKTIFDGSIDYAESLIINRCPLSYKHLVEVTIATITAEEGDDHVTSNDPDFNRIAEFTYTGDGAVFVYIVASSNSEDPRFWKTAINPSLHVPFFVAHPITSLTPGSEVVTKFLEIASQIALDLAPLTEWNLSQYG